LLQQDLKIGIAQRPELVDETDAGKELRIPRESLFDSGHADEHHAQAALIEDGAQLLQTVHRQTICFIDNYKGSRIRDSLEPGLVLVERVVVCRLKRQGMVGSVISVIPMPEQKNASQSVTFGDQFSLTIIDRPKIPKKEATFMSLRAAFQWLSTFIRSL
jgi:hypothetical protein